MDSHLQVLERTVRGSNAVDLDRQRLSKAYKDSVDTFEEAQEILSDTNNSKYLAQAMVEKFPELDYMLLELGERRTLAECEDEFVGLGGFSLENLEYLCKKGGYERLMTPQEGHHMMMHTVEEKSSGAYFVAGDELSFYRELFNEGVSVSSDGKMILFHQGLVGGQRGFEVFDFDITGCASRPLGGTRISKDNLSDELMQYLWGRTGREMPLTYNLDFRNRKLSSRLGRDLVVSARNPEGGFRTQIHLMQNIGQGPLVNTYPHPAGGTLEVDAQWTHVRPVRLKRFW